MDWLYKFSDPLWQTLLGSILIFLAIIVLTRMVGLRSFAKFTAYDFAFTVAIGSIIASTLTSATSVTHGTVAIASLLFLTWAFSSLQKKSSALSAAISNAPLLLMDGTKILEENLKYARVEKSQLIAKLREANVYQLDQVLAVVLESTGDISVLHKSTANEEAAVDELIMEGVREKH